jgi:predicted enzyme related to lactoylglutathione lyase
MKCAVLIMLTLGAAFGEAPAPRLRISMISVGVKDVNRSINFYSDMLGLQLVGKPGEVTLFRAGDVTLVVNQPLGLASRTTGSESVEIVFPVDSVASSYKSLTERGCHFVKSPHEITPGTWAATFTDPDGHLLTILGAQ